MGNRYFSWRLLSCRVAVCALGLISAHAMAANNPVDENWWPSAFGAEDQSGAVNYITPEKRLEAVKLVKQGKTLTLGMPYQRGMPLASERTYALLILGGGRPMQGPARWQGNAFQQTFNDEFLSTYYPSESFKLLVRDRYSLKMIQRKKSPEGGLLPATSRMPSAAQATGSLDQGGSSEAIADRKSAGADPPSAEKRGKPAGPSDGSGWKPALGAFRGRYHLRPH